ncbi:MAG: GNAT family N-acetyltransferase [Armatimonadota bacterium]
MDTGDFTFRNVPPLRDGELELRLMDRRPGNAARGTAPSYFFEMRVGEVFAGRIDLRVGETEALVMYGGHIGYFVTPEFRGHHFAERAARLLLPLAKSHGLTTLWITCNPDNIPSRRTCERLGATLVEIVRVPKDSDLYLQGERAKCRYRLQLVSVR